MRLAHHRRGSGEPLVLVHGLGSQWQMWRPVIGVLARERDVIAVDLPGFGASLTLRDRPPDVPALAAAVAEFVAGLGHRTFHVAGNSLGGGVALELGRNGTARSVCALSPIGFYTAAGLAWTRAVLRAGRAGGRAVLARPRLTVAGPVRRTLAFGAYVARPWSMTADDAAEALLNLALSPGFDAAIEHALPWRFPTGTALPCPVTIAWGQRDRLLPRSPQAARACAALPDARHLTLRGCGHVPTFDDPAQVARVLLVASSG